MWLSLLLVTFRSWSYEWNKERSCKIALSVPELFLLERFWPRTVCVVYYRPKARFMEYDSLSVKEVMREWPYHREQEPALFHCNLTHLFPALTLWMEPMERVDGCDSRVWLHWQPSLRVREGIQSWPRWDPPAIPGAWGREDLGQQPLGMWALAPQKNERFALLHTGALHPFGGLVSLCAEQDIAHAVAIK